MYIHYTGIYINKKIKKVVFFKYIYLKKTHLMYPCNLKTNFNCINTNYL